MIDINKRCSQSVLHTLKFAAFKIKITNKRFFLSLLRRKNDYNITNHNILTHSEIFDITPIALANVAKVASINHHPRNKVQLLVFREHVA